MGFNEWFFLWGYGVFVVCSFLGSKLKYYFVVDLGLLVSFEIGLLSDLFRIVVVVLGICVEFGIIFLYSFFGLRETVFFLSKDLAGFNKGG